MTTGSVAKNIVYFSLPYFFSYFLQTLYGMADLFIIGQFEGAASITAVSIGSQVMHMLTVMIVGLAMGTTVTIAQAVGAEDHQRIRKAIGTTTVLFFGVSLVLAVLLVALRGGITSAMETPIEAVPGTQSYLLICFFGIPLITAYNIIASIFRGLGDAKSPMYFVAVACLCNIALDYLFMGAMAMGPSGAAWGTVISQAISVVLALAYVKSGRAGIALTRQDFRPERPVLRRLLRIGVPISLQDGFIQVAFLVITVIANMRGLTDAAAVGIVEKIISFIFLVPSSMLSTVSALGAQNIGAGKVGRAQQTLRYALAMTVGFGITVSIFTQYAAYDIVALFTYDAAVIVAGRGVPAGLHLRLHPRGHPLLLQRLLLRLWTLRDLVPAQHRLHRDSPHPARLPDLHLVPHDPVPDGPRDGSRLPRVRRHLHRRLPLPSWPRQSGLREERCRCLKGHDLSPLS